MRKEVMRKISNDQFNIKYSLYKDMIYNIAYTYCHNVTDADDIVQDVFMKYLKSNEYFKTLENEKYWLIRVSINTSITYLKKAWKQKVILDNEKVFLSPNINKKDDHSEIFECVFEMPNKYKDVIILYYYEDLNIEEISAALKISKANVKKRLERGRNYIKEKVKK